MPYCVADITGRILWMNQEMGAILGDDKAAIRNITQMFPDITKEMLATGGETVSIHSAFKDKVPCGHERDPYRRGSGSSVSVRAG